jgi:hypothetical protein
MESNYFIKQTGIKKGYSEPKCSKDGEENIELSQ